MAAQVIDGSLEEVRIQLNAIPNEGQRARVVVWTEEPAPHTPDPENAAAIAYLTERLQIAPTNPEQTLQSESEIAELQRQLNKNRLEAGERPLFSE